MNESQNVGSKVLESTFCPACFPSISTLTNILPSRGRLKTAISYQSSVSRWVENKGKQTEKEFRNYATLTDCTDSSNVSDTSKSILD
jgi:hypothetical protein